MPYVTAKFADLSYQGDGFTEFAVAEDLCLGLVC